MIITVAAKKRFILHCYPADKTLISQTFTTDPQCPHPQERAHVYVYMYAPLYSQETPKVLKEAP